MIYWISYFIIKILNKIFFPFTIHGKENIPVKGGFIFASNHLSNLDPFLIGLSVWRPISYMAKDSLFRNRILRFFLGQVGAFSVKREGPDIGALREAIRRLKGGSPLVVFPEGSRKGSKAVLNEPEKTLHPGIAFLAARSSVPVVPVYIIGSDKVLPRGARWFKRHPMTLVYGPPVTFSKSDSYTHIAQEIMERILSLSESEHK